MAIAENYTRAETYARVGPLRRELAVFMFSVKRFSSSLISSEYRRAWELTPIIADCGLWVADLSANS
jgi:hypothetical protein